MLPTFFTVLDLRKTTLLYWTEFTFVLIST